jgi:hypothetical protein
MKLTIYLVLDITRKGSSSLCGVYSTRKLAELSILQEVEDSIYVSTTSKDFVIIEELLS